MVEKEKAMLTTEETRQIIESRKEEMKVKFGDKAYLLLSEILLLVEATKGDEQTRLIPVSKWEEFHKYPTVSAIRNYITDAEKNGFNEVLERKGRRLWVDETKLFKWLRGNKCQSV